LPVLFYSAVPFYRSAWGALRKGEASIDLPISLGLLAGGGVSFFHLLRGSGEIYFDTVSSLAFLLLGTRYLLNRVQHRAQAASRLIHFLAPSRARRLEADGTFVEARAEDPRPGDQIEVAPGEAFPVDGKVIAGRGTISTAVLDGESAARLAQPGWQVFAGALNLSSPLRIEVQASGSATRLSRVLEAVQRSLGSRPPIVLFLDRVGRGLVWAVLLLTVLAFGVGASESLAEGFRRAMAMAIIVCPCTFALATPLAFSLALRRAAAVGVLIKSAEAIERLARVRRVFLDKTGTLTAGALEVLSWTPLEPSATTALFFLERPSRHPIARAVERDLRAQLDFEFEAETSASLTDYRETPGAGIEARIGGAHYRVGRLGLSAWKPEEPHHSSEAPLTSVGLWRDGVLAGKLLLGDRIRPDSISIVDKLKKRDLRSSFSRATRRPPSERSRSSRESPIETRSLKPVRKKKAVFCAQAATR
jgi:P-type E1-E2 ATPase